MEADARRGEERLNFWHSMDPHEKIVADLENFNLNVSIPDPRKAPFGFEYLSLMTPSSAILQAID